MDRELLQQHINNRLSSHQIAKATKLSQTTIAYWLKKHGLKTNPLGRRTSGPDDHTGLTCCICDRSLVARLVAKGSSRCDGCFQKQRRYLIKLAIVDQLGGCCIRCGWSGHLSGYDLHHTDPTQKEFALSCPNNKSLERIKAELAKCELLCALCHREEHSSYTTRFLESLTNLDRFVGKFGDHMENQTPTLR